MQVFQILAILGFTSSVFALPAAEANPEAAAVAEAEAANSLLLLPLPTLIGGNTVQCSSGNVYCSDGDKNYVHKKKDGDTCTSGKVVCCNSVGTILPINLIPICGNNIKINIPVVVDVL